MEDLEKSSSAEKAETLRPEPKTTSQIALIVTGLLVFVAILASFQTDAMSVLDKVETLVGVVFGYYFGRVLPK